MACAVHVNGCARVILCTNFIMFSIKLTTIYVLTRARQATFVHVAHVTKYKFSL